MRSCYPIINRPERNDTAEWDRYWMSLALKKASEAIVGNDQAGQMEVPIAAMFIDNSSRQLLASAHNATNVDRDATRHAEIMLIERLISRQITDFSNLTLYVTVEPCVMCASALISVGVSCIVYGASNDKFGGCGSVLDIFHFMNHPGITVTRGLFADYAVELLRRFYVHGNTQAPRPQRQLTDDMCSNMDGCPDQEGPTTRDILKRAVLRQSGG